VGDYRSIVRRGQFSTGDLVAYIPEQSVLSAVLLDEMGLTGKLAGKDMNRVKAIKLRGVLSQGLCYPARAGWKLGQNVADELGITKYEPPIPGQMSGQVYSAGLERTVRYDIENYKAFPEVLRDGEPVVFTEKIHGTWCQIGVLPTSLADATHGPLVVSSKGMAGKGLAFMPDASDNENNLYLRAARHLGVRTRVEQIMNDLLDAGRPVFILGEVFGAGVQDLAYGASAERDASLGFRVFDVYVGVPGQGEYLSDQALDTFCERLLLTRVPVLYRGPFSREVMEQYTNGKESVSGKQAHIREGIVMRPQIERRDEMLGRVQLKSVSEAYLLRKGGTEFN
jgi:RNA ligase (TIGR02306 family)